MSETTPELTSQRSTGPASQTSTKLDHWTVSGTSRLSKTWDLGLSDALTSQMRG